MRVIALSDSHGMKSNLTDAILQAQRGGKIDACVFLGDGLRDFEAVKPILLHENPTCRLVEVRGNNDFGAQVAYTEVFEVGGCRFLATHGQLFHVKYGMESLLNAACLQNVQVALYGHTHFTHVEPIYGVWLVNPGAICERREGKPAFAEILVDDKGTPRVSLVNWQPWPSVL